MVGLLYYVGALIIVIAFISGLFVPLGFLYIGGSIVSGIFFMALGKIVELLQKIEQKLPERSDSIAYRDREYKVRSTDFVVYDAHNETYQFFRLDGDDFIQVRVFKNYIEIRGELIVFNLPNKEQLEFRKHPSYHAAEPVITRDNIVFVRLASLGIRASHLGNSIVLSYTDKS